ncbi:MAG: nickel transporter permease [bacterium]
MKLREIITKDKNKRKLLIYLILVGLLLLTAAFAKHICPYDPNMQNLNEALRSPCLQHPCGTDRYGRDVFSRVLVGATTSIFSTLALVLLISGVGTAIGVSCGYLRGWLDTIVMRISDICLAFPGLVFALAIAAVLKGGIQNAVFALAAISWPKYARIARSQTLALKTVDFISAAKMAGGSAFKIIVRHILPNIIGPILVTAMLDIGTMMMELAALSFLGLGAMPPTAEWGSMMSTGRSMIQSYPWMVLSPGAAIFISVVLFNLLGDTVRDYADARNMQK